MENTISRKWDNVTELKANIQYKASQVSFPHHQSPLHLSPPHHHPFLLVIIILLPVYEGFFFCFVLLLNPKRENPPFSPSPSSLPTDSCQSVFCIYEFVSLFCSFDSTYKWNHLAEYSPGSSMLSQRIRFPSCFLFFYSGVIFFV